MILFVSEHPGAFLALFGGLFSICAAALGAYWTVIVGRLAALEERDKTLADRMTDVEVTLSSYKAHVGAGDAMLVELKAGIAGLSTQISDMHTENLEAHAQMGERLAKVETKMPNGELREMLTLLRNMGPR